MIKSLIRMRVKRKVCGRDDGRSLYYVSTDHDLLLLSSSSQGGPVQGVKEGCQVRSTSAWYIVSLAASL